MSGAICSRSWRQAGRGDTPAGPRGSLVVRDAGDRSATRGGPLQGQCHRQAAPGHCGPMHNDNSWAPQRSRPGTGRRSRAAADRREPGFCREYVCGLFGRTSRAPQRASDGAGLSCPSGGRRLPGLTEPCTAVVPSGVPDPSGGRRLPGLTEPVPAGRPSAPFGVWRSALGTPAANWGPGGELGKSDRHQCAWRLPQFRSASCSDPDQTRVRTGPGSRCRPARRRSGRWPPGRTPAGRRASGWSRGYRRRPPARRPSCRRRCGCPSAGWATR
jgi:hypothetical protein